MVNGYLENNSKLAGEWPITLFITAGAGVATASVKSIAYKNSTIISSSNDTEFAYQGGLGGGYELTKNITFDLSYKYLTTSNFQFGNIKADYGSHNVLLGAKYIFR